MPRFRVEEQYLMKIWRNKVYFCDAVDEESVYSGEIENEIVLSDEESESEYDGWSEIDDIYLVDKDGIRIDDE